MSLEPAPTPYAADFGLADNHLCTLARHASDGQAVGYCERTTWRASVNGAPANLPYLGAHRVAQADRSRIRVLRGGVRALRVTERADETGFALTSVAEDHAPARRVLTAGTDGLPRYNEIGRFVTLFLRARRGRMPPGIRPAREVDLPRIADLANNVRRGRNFAPVWSAQSFAALSESGLHPRDFLLAEEHGRQPAPVGEAAPGGEERSEEPPVVCRKMNERRLRDPCPDRGQAGHSGQRGEGVGERAEPPERAGVAANDRLAPFVFTILKGLTPGHIETHSIDERIEPFASVRIDFVAMTVETFTARRACELADRYRRRASRW